MRQRLASLILATTPLVGACSLIYNPSNLPPSPAEAGPVDAPDPDAEIILDTNPDALALESVEPSVLVEGQGVGGSYKVILVVHGTQLVKNMTSVAITTFDTATPITGITVDNTKLDVSANGRDLAVPVSIAVDPTLGAGMRIRLNVAVTQMGASGPITAMLPTEAMLELEYLDELTNTSPQLVNNKLPPASYRFSQVDITGGGLGATANTEPLRVQSMSSISIVGPIDVNATGNTPGPGGNTGAGGGAGSTLGPAVAGGTGNGPGGGKSSGGGGGFGTVGLGGAAGGAQSGQAGIADLALNRSSGGGGGVGGVGLGAPAGGTGGAGGGAIELTAGGDLTIDNVVANGGNGTGSNASNGGGGSGGTILLRSRHTVTITGSLNATGGLAGANNNGAAGHMGGNGRIRVDAPSYPAIAGTPASYRGPMLMLDTPMITRTEFPTFVVTGEKTKNFSYYFTNSNGDMTQLGDVQLVGPGASGTQQFKLPMDKPLFRGINHFCLLVDGATAASPSEGTNCFEIVYLYTP